MLVCKTFTLILRNHKIEYLYSRIAESISTRSKGKPPSQNITLHSQHFQARPVWREHVSNLSGVPARLLLHLELGLDSVAVEGGAGLLAVAAAQVRAGVRQLHGLRLRLGLGRLQLDARRGDRLRHAASLHVTGLICNITHNN